MTPDKVRKFAPELTAADDLEIQCFIDLVVDLLDADAFGKQYTNAVALYAAHWMLVSAMGDADATGAGFGAGANSNGQLTSVKERNWSVTFGGILSGAEAGLRAGTDASLVTTRVGKLFLTIRNTRAAAHARIICP